MAVKSAIEARVSADIASRSTEGLTTMLSAEHFGEKLGDFCDSVARGLDSINGRMSHYSLDAIEMHVELTPKGEVRLIAAAAAEVRGAFRLTFRAKSDGPPERAEARAERRGAEWELERFRL